MLAYVWQYIFNILIAIDQFANALLAGNPDETISSRCGKRLKQGCVLCNWLCWFLRKIDPGHCKDSIEVDE